MIYLDATPDTPSGAMARGRILLAAGGTGGHIYPAAALAEVLREMAPEAEVRFCCGDRPAELQIYKRLGVEPWVLPVAHHRAGLANQARFAMGMLKAFNEARRLTGQWRPDVAVGFGSYISTPPMLAAWMRHAKLILHEQNVRPGAANRVLAWFATAIATGSPAAQGRFSSERAHHLGNPVRPSLFKEIDRAEALKFFRLNPERPVLLVIGGSQGAEGINRIVETLAARMQDPDSPLAHWQLLWATGPTHYESVNRALKDMGADPDDYRVNPYIAEMSRAYRAADVALARSGALTLAELTALGLPSVLVPLPTSAGGHQALNARWLVQAGAAEIVEQADPRAADKLEEFLTDWGVNPGILEAMGQAARALGRRDAARDLARIVLGVK